MGVCNHLSRAGVVEQCPSYPLLLHKQGPNHPLKRGTEQPMDCFTHTLPPHVIRREGRGRREEEEERASMPHLVFESGAPNDLLNFLRTFGLYNSLTTALCANHSRAGGTCVSHSHARCPRVTHKKTNRFVDLTSRTPCRASEDQRPSQPPVHLVPHRVLPAVLEYGLH